MSRPKPNLLKVLRQNLPRDCGLLLAVSGGLDSCSLLAGCVALAKEHRLRLEVAHVNHKLRKEADRDALFVRALAKKYGVKFHQKVARRKPAAGENLEAWGRALRYDYFGKLLLQRKLSFVVTAHTANDLAETFLMRLVSNKELRGISAYDARRRLLRPLLTLPRCELEQYARANKLEHREDGSNSDEAFLRNRIRGRLLPLLARSFDSRIVETLAERSLALDEDYIALDSILAASLQRLDKEDFGSKNWLRGLKRALARIPLELRWRLVELVLLPKLNFRLGRMHSKRLVHFFTGTSLNVELPGGSQLRRQAGGIRFLQPASKNGRRA